MVFESALKLEDKLRFEAPNNSVQICKLLNAVCGCGPMLVGREVCIKI